MLSATDWPLACTMRTCSRLQLARVPHAAGVRDHVDLAVHAVGVVGDAQVLLLHHQRALQALVVRGDAGRAGVLVAAQRLDAAEREHEAARGVDEIGADAQRPGGARGGDDLARGDDADALPQARSRSAQSTTRGSASSIDRPMWSASACGAAPEPPSPPSIDQEVRARTPGRGGGSTSASSFMKRQPPIAVLTPTGRPVRSRIQRDLVQQLVHVGDVAVAVRADRVAPFRDAADLRDLGGHLLRRQHAALAGLRALRQLDLEGLHRPSRSSTSAFGRRGCPARRARRTWRCRSA